MNLPRVFITLTLTIQISGCLGIPSQNPLDSFVSGKFPRQLEMLRSQLRELTQTTKDQIIARTQTDTKRQDLLRVAVIDSGVDLAQPDLTKQIEYRVENGRIVGSGVDIMGGSRFASHILVDPSPFALTPFPLKDGKIDKYPKRPLEDLRKINDRFTHLLLEGIRSDPDLNSFPFNRLTEQNFTILGFDKYFGRGKDVAIQNDIKSFKRAVLPPIDPKNPKNAKEKKYIGQITEANWVLPPGSDQIAGEEFNLMMFQHYDKYLKVVSKALDQVQGEYLLWERIENFNRFLKPDDAQFGDGLRASDELKKLMSFVKFGYQQFDPVAQVIDFFKNDPEYGEMPIDQGIESYVDSLRKDAKTVLASGELDPEKRRVFQDSETELKKLQTMLLNIVHLNDDPKVRTRHLLNLRKNYYRTAHPYLSSESATNDHATHVAGTIAKQDARIRIVPIRVNVQSTSGASTTAKESLKEVFALFEGFLETSYFEPLLAAISKEHSTRLSKERVRREAYKYLKRNGLTTQFISDVYAAIRATGEQKIKLANVSLGVEFEKKSDGSDKPSAVTEDVLAEFFRFEMGRQIKTFSPKTLFLVATGNDGRWIDGISRTDFPVGITSVRLDKVSLATGLPPTPNNSVTNVVAVGSVNKQGHLTHFTNVLIDPHVPTIFSTGELIQSTVTGKGQEFAFKLIQKRIEKIKAILSSVQEYRSMTTTEDDLDNVDIHTSRRMNRDTIFQMLVDGSFQKLIEIQGEVDRQTMSGTSMATPTTTGVLAHYILEKIEREGITGDQYNHPALAPAQLIKDLFSISKKRPYTDSVSLDLLVEGIKEWRKSPAEAKLQAFEKSLTVPNGCDRLLMRK